MSFNDLSATAKDGLNYLATTMRDDLGALRFADGKAVLDHFGEVEGSQAVVQRETDKFAARVRKIATANAAALAALDSTPDPG
jgi:hypothetical protein